MPYIPKKRRKPLNRIVAKMHGLKMLINGELNYILFAFCVRHIDPSYNNYKNFCGELRQCATEIERRLLAPYEDRKIEENGDVE